MSIIVSMTSHSARLVASAARACFSILDQTVRPDKFILWIGSQYKNDISPLLQWLQEGGLEIRFTEDVGPATKLIPALQAFPDDVIITVDDDRNYPRDTLENLVRLHNVFPAKIVSNSVKELQVDSEGNFINGVWNYEVIRNSSLLTKFMWPQGFGGVLYPPKSLHQDVFDIDLLKEICFTHDDVWFYGMSILAGTDRVWTQHHHGPVYRIEPDNAPGETALWKVNNTEHNSSAKHCFDRLFNRYPQIRKFLKHNI